MQTLQPLRIMEGCIHIDQTDGREFLQCESCTSKVCEQAKNSVRLIVGLKVPDWFIDKKSNLTR